MITVKNIIDLHISTFFINDIDENIIIFLKSDGLYNDVNFNNLKLYIKNFDDDSLYNHDINNIKSLIKNLYRNAKLLKMINNDNT